MSLALGLVAMLAACSNGPAPLEVSEGADPAPQRIQQASAGICVSVDAYTGDCTGFDW